jgi:lantibiotic biosynthesis protein
MTTAEYGHSGFFVLRTPLLPVDTFVDWSRHASDVDALRDKLARIASLPEVREAIFLASPDLDETLQPWLDARLDGNRARRVERAVLRYFSRMVVRPTPFGLCAGWSTGSIGSNTNLTLAPRGRYRRQTRPDTEAMWKLARAIEQAPELREVIRYYPNSSAYELGGQIRYAEAREGPDGREYHLVSTVASDHLRHLLASSDQGLTRPALAAAVSERLEVPLPEAAGYIDSLIDGQLLVSELTLEVTGPEPLEQLRKKIAGRRPGDHRLDVLGRVAESLRQLDDAGLANASVAYRSHSQIYSELGETPPLARLVQVDMVKPTLSCTLDPVVVGDLLSGARIMHRIGTTRQSGSLDKFRADFMNRYEGAAVPLVEVLDSDLGLGFDTKAENLHDPSPLLVGLRVDDRPGAHDGETRQASRQQRVLEAKIRAAGQVAVLHLDDRDLADLEPEKPRDPLPDAFSVHAVIGQAGPHLEHGYEVLLKAIYGPAGANLLGRFCHPDPELSERVKAHFKAEEGLAGEAVLAEIVHLPEGRVGNVLLRPALRSHEIRYLAGRTEDSAAQIPVQDLLVSVVAGRVTLFSRRLGREIIPRMATAHAFAYRSLPVYKFLCVLQRERMEGSMHWEWGALDAISYTPRIQVGRVVLAVARWRIEPEHHREWCELTLDAALRRLAEWRAQERVPRFVLVTESETKDVEQLIDLKNPLSVDMLQQFLSRVPLGKAVLREWFPGPDRLCVEAAEGRFANDIVVPFVRHPRSPTVRRLGVFTARKVVRTFAPGSEWLYAKFYTGRAAADQILREPLSSLVAAIIEDGLADSWFFVRYGEPDWHLRVRFHVVPEAWPEVARRIGEFGSSWTSAGLMHRIQWDTYKREVERYGGPASILVAEDIFRADSDAVLDAIGFLTGSDALDDRWRFAVAGAARLVRDFGLTDQQAHALAAHRRDEHKAERALGRSVLRRLDMTYRQHRASIEDLLTLSPKSLPAELVALLDTRSQSVEPSVARLAVALQGRPPRELLPDFIHMFLNRLLRSSHGLHEYVIYDFLARAYESKEKRVTASRRVVATD